MIAKSQRFIASGSDGDAGAILSPTSAGSASSLSPTTGKRRKAADAPKPLPAVFKPSKVGALNRLGQVRCGVFGDPVNLSAVNVCPGAVASQSTFQSETKSQFEFSSEIKEVCGPRHVAVTASWLTAIRCC